MTTLFLYIDPGSGSYLVQVIIAAILGGAFWIKTLLAENKIFLYQPGKKET